MIVVKKFLMQILIWLLQLLDEIFALFRLLTGIDEITILGSGESMTLIDYFLQAPTVTKVFWSLFLVSIFVIMVSMITSVVKTIINIKGGERKPHSRTVFQGIVALFMSIAMASIMITGISVANGVLVYVNKSFNQNSDASSIPQIVFEMSVEKTFEVDYDAMNMIGEDNKPLYIDEDGNYTTIIYKETMTNGWVSGAPSPLNFDTLTPDEVYGTYSKNILGLEMDGIPKKAGLIHPESFNFIIGYFGTIILMVALCSSMLGLVKRLYDLVLLFLSLPLISGTIPLDDGAYFKLWRETVISKVILAYGAVLSVNVFLIFVPMINGINFDVMGQVGSIFKLFLVAGAGLSISTGQLLFARLFGTSAEESREMTQSFRTLLAAGAAGAGGAKMIKNTLFGKGGSTAGSGLASSLRERGAVGTGLKVASKAVNAAGNIIGGNAYRSAVSKISGAAGKTIAALKGATSATGESSNKFMQGNGLLGATKASISKISEPSLQGIMGKRARDAGTQHPNKFTQQSTVVQKSSKTSADSKLTHAQGNKSLNSTATQNLQKPLDSSKSMLVQGVEKPTNTRGNKKEK